MRRAGRKRKASPVTLAAVRALTATPTVTLDRDTAPTPERLAKVGLTVMQLGTGRVQIIGADAAGIVQGDGTVRVEPSPLDRLRGRNRLDEADPDRNHQLAAAGERLRYHHHRAGLSGFTSAANDRALSGRADPSRREGITEAMEANRRLYYRAEAAMHPGDWAVVHGVVIGEQTLEAVGQALGLGSRTAGRPVALDRLRRGLQTLAELWGFLTPDRRDVLASAEPANVNAERSDGASVKVGSAKPHRSAGRRFSRARVPIGSRADRPR